MHVLITRVEVPPCASWFEGCNKNPHRDLESLCCGNLAASSTGLLPRQWALGGILNRWAQACLILFYHLSV